jgi:CDP-diacylglycerol--glycerol-3-phosphate 3-phosphatidyltransferase
MDRVSEGALLLGLLIFYTRGATFDQMLAILAFIAFSGSMMVSYVRARAEGLGMKGTAGFATRPERVVVVAVTLLISQPDWGLWILAVATPLSALHRFWAEWHSTGDSD